LITNARLSPPLISTSLALVEMKNAQRAGSSPTLQRVDWAKKTFPDYNFSCSLTI
jgi:hypothetical protein